MDPSTDNTGRWLNRTVMGAGLTSALGDFCYEFSLGGVYVATQEALEATVSAGMIEPDILTTGMGALGAVSGSEVRCRIRYHPGMHRNEPDRVSAPACTLCGAPTVRLTADRRRSFYRCGRCALVFADPASHLDLRAEKAEYDLHRNDPADICYRQFLDRLATPLLRKLRVGMHGLDYGSGPGPTLSLMLEEAGMRMSLFDPFYAADGTVLGRQYDFVTCTEVVEHFRYPRTDWTQLVRVVRPGGWLGVMTRCVTGIERFSGWQYKNDPTHVSFYSAQTFAWLGGQFGLSVETVGNDVILMCKRESD